VISAGKIATHPAASRSGWRPGAVAGTPRERASDWLPEAATELLVLASTLRLAERGRTLPAWPEAAATRVRERQAFVNARLLHGT